MHYTRYSLITVNRLSSQMQALVPWFREELALGWGFVGRTRLPNPYSLDTKNWQSITDLYRKANSGLKK